MNLKDVIQQALATCGIDHDDLDLMSDEIEKRVLAAFTVSAKDEPCEFSAALDELQAKILRGEYPEGELSEIAQALEEELASLRWEEFTFERVEAFKRLQRKVAYLRNLLHERRHQETVTRLQAELKGMVSPAAWRLYMRLAEATTAEMTRLKEGATR